MSSRKLISASLFVPVVLWGDASGTITMANNSGLDLDTADINSQINLNGRSDLFWAGGGSEGTLSISTGSALVGAGLTFFNSLTQATLASYNYSTGGLGYLLGATPIGALSPVYSGGRNVFAVKTKCGNYSKILLNDLNSNDGSLILQFVTYTTNGNTGCPEIGGLQNNYSYLLPVQPNYGIAPGSLFIIRGTDLSNQPLTSLQSSQGLGLPTTLNGTSISVTVNGVTVTPAIYYTSPTQVAAVLPSNTPTGTGTITITNAGVTTSLATIHVAQSAIGFDTIDGSGGGMAVAEDANYNLFSKTNSASPGQTIILWGSGVGADTSNDDKTYPLKQNNLNSIPVQIYIGGLSADILYRGRSQFPGVDQVVVTIPSAVALGCSVSVVAIGGGLVSNSVTIPIAAGGGACSDPILSAGLFPIQPQGVRYGTVVVSQGNSFSTNFAQATFVSVISPVPARGLTPSLGSCLVGVSAFGSAGQNSYLDAGAVQVSNPSGGVQPLPLQSGVYGNVLPSTFFPSSGGAYTFSGSGGKDVGTFTTTLNLMPLTAVEAGDGTTVLRSQDQKITWKGGVPGTFVNISGSVLLGSVGVLGFVCNAPTDEGQFTIPSWVLSAMPATPGGAGTSFFVSNSSNLQSFTASGLDLAYGVAKNQNIYTVFYK